MYAICHEFNVLYCVICKNCTVITGHVNYVILLLNLYSCKRIKIVCVCVCIYVPDRLLNHVAQRNQTLHDGTSKFGEGSHFSEQSKFFFHRIHRSHQYLITLIIRDAVVKHLEINGLVKMEANMDLEKSGFCLSNLLQFLDQVTRSIDEGECIDVVFLDFAKAFDKVPRRRLMEKLERDFWQGLGLD